MKIFLSGGEKGSHRSLLVSAGVKRIAINVTQLAIPKRKELHLPSLFPSCELGVYTSEGDEDDDRYDSFIRDHFDALSFVVGKHGYNGEWLGSKHIPIWSDVQDLERLAWLCQKEGRIAIPDKAITGKTLPRIKSLSQRWGCSLYGFTSKPDTIAALPWDTVIVSSWTSVLRYGETQVWDGHSLRRYPAQQKDSSRKRHRADIQRLGIDVDAVLEDNVDAVGKLAIMSWLEWEKRTLAYDLPEIDDEDEFDSPEGGEIVTTTPQTQHGGLVDSAGVSITITPSEKRHESDRVLLPVMGIEHISSIGSKMPSEQGESIELAPEQVPVVTHSGLLLRQCDSCYLASRCPAFKEHSECGFKIPVEIKTKDQLQSALRALLEMQMGRILFARFAEELEGQGMDPSLSKELDRMFDLVNKFKDISDSRELIKMEIETRSTGGVLSRLFGTKAGETARQLSGPVQDSTFNALAMDIIDMGYEDE